MGSELLKMADGFALVAEGLRGLAKGDIGLKAADEKVLKEKNKVVNEQALKEDKSKEVLGKKESKVSVEDIRAVLAQKSQDGKSKEVKALLNKFGVVKLSAVEEKDYPALLSDAEVL